MPVVDHESLIASEKPGARSPLKKSTVGWIVGGLFALSIAGATVPALFSKSEQPAALPEAKAPSTLPGDGTQIDQEVLSAKRKVADAAAAPASAASASARPPHLAQSPGLPVGAFPSASAPVIPDRARRDDNSAALYGRSAPGGEVSVEIDAAARQSASLKHDFSEGGARPAAAAQSESGIERLRNSLMQQQAANGTPAEPDRARDRVLAAMEAERRGSQAVTGTSADRAWLKEVSGSGDAPRATLPLRTYKVGSPFTLLQGKTIPAVLTRELNSDLPGLVTACTTLPVYDSLTSEHLLIPRGSCLQGQYSSAIGPGQERLLFAFNRLCMPDNTCVDLPGSPGADAAGAAGVEGNVNNHFFRSFSTSLMVALLADRSERNKTIVQSGSGGGAPGPATAAGQVLVDVSRSILDRNKSVSPTITVPKGARINVEVTRDIEFQGPYRKGSSS
ncbi:MAG: TrbI/VirB10 family protein [Vicinamibacterales bacterium]